MLAAEILTPPEPAQERQEIKITEIRVHKPGNRPQ